MVRNVFIVGWFFFGVNAYGQKGLFFGAAAGIGNTFTVIDRAGVPYHNLRDKAAYNAPLGLLLRYNINDTISLSSGINRLVRTMRVGYRKDPLTLFKNQKDYNASYGGWQVPLVLGYRFKKSKDVRGFFTINPGLQFEFDYGSSGCRSMYKTPHLQYGTESMHAESAFTGFGYSARVGVGYEKVLRNGSILIFSITYSKGLTKIVEGKFKYWRGPLATYDTTRNYLNYDLACEPRTDDIPTEEYSFHSRGSSLFFQASWLLPYRRESKPTRREQEEDKYDYSPLLFQRDHYSVKVSSVSPWFKHSKIWGKGSLFTYPAPGGIVGFAYHKNLNDNFSLESGINVGLLGYGIYFRVDTPEFDLPWAYYRYNKWKYEPAAEIPVKLNMRLKRGNNAGLVSSLGMTWTYYYNVETSSAVAINDNGKGGDLFEITLDFFAGSIHPGYFFGLGYDRIPDFDTYDRVIPLKPL